MIGLMIDGSEIRRSPVEVGSLSHYLRRFYTSQVVGLGISEPSTVAGFVGFEGLW